MLAKMVAEGLGHGAYNKKKKILTWKKGKTKQRQWYVWYSHQQTLLVGHSYPKSLLWLQDESPTKPKLDSNAQSPFGRSPALLHREQTGPTETHFLCLKLLFGKALPKQNSETLQGLSVFVGKDLI